MPFLSDGIPRFPKNIPPDTAVPAWAYLDGMSFPSSLPRPTHECLHINSRVAWPFQPHRSRRGHMYVRTPTHPPPPTNTPPAAPESTGTPTPTGTIATTPSGPPTPTSTPKKSSDVGMIIGIVVGGKFLPSIHACSIRSHKLTPGMDFRRARNGPDISSRNNISRPPPPPPAYAHHGGTTNDEWHIRQQTRPDQFLLFLTANLNISALQPPNRPTSPTPPACEYPASLPRKLSVISKHSNSIIHSLPISLQRRPLAGCMVKIRNLATTTWVTLFQAPLTSSLIWLNSSNIIVSPPIPCRRRIWPLTGCTVEIHNLATTAWVPLF